MSEITDKPINKPIPGRIVRREVTDHYTLIEEAPAGYNTTGIVYLETKCVGKYAHTYRIDSHHPAYAEVKGALDRGDSSVLFCYHKSRKRD